MFWGELLLEQKKPINDPLAVFVEICAQRRTNYVTRISSWLHAITFTADSFIQKQYIIFSMIYDNIFHFPVNTLPLQD